MTLEEQPPATMPDPSSSSSSTTTTTTSSKSHGLPVANPCLSYWQQTTRSYPYLNANATQPVSSSSPTKYLILGSGISGALTAFTLIHSANVPGSQITILEAREAASGASGRNAGHVRPDAFRGFQVYRRVHGTAQALKIIANERDVFHQVDRFVKKWGCDCDFHPTTTLDVCLTEDFARFNATSLREFRDAGGDASHITVYEGEAARQRTGIAQTVSAYEWPAGSSHPAKLAQWLLTKSIEAGATLYTHCPATALRPSPTTSGSSNSSNSSSAAAATTTTTTTSYWDVETPRGTITAENVIHCTNAFAGHLLPQVAPYITPNRAQAHLFVPPPSLAGDKMLTSTMSLRHSLHHFYSVMQRSGPSSGSTAATDGMIILGASRKSPNLSPHAFESMFTTDDTGINPEVRDDAVRNFAQCVPACGAEQLRHGEGLQHTWTGILGMTTDSVPFVGKLAGRPGQYVCAGFNGHGMARIFNCAPGLVKIIQGEPWAATGLPECFEVTQERLDRLAKGAMETVF